jgi:ribosomal-protein-alanine N-acetyltransferase
MIRLETDRLEIRNFRNDDWRDLHEIALQYQASEYAQYDHPWPTDEEGVKGMVEWFASRDSYLAACLKETGKLIGLLTQPKKEELEGVVHGLGYVFNFDYHGQGYATEGCTALLDHAFGPLAADRVVTGTAEANQPSCRLLRRLGLRPIGQGKWTISKEEWLERRRHSPQPNL